MSLALPSRPRSSRREALYALAYLLIVVGLGLLTLWLLLDVLDRANGVAAQSVLLAQIEGRKTPRNADNVQGEPTFPRSPFLDGQTVTIAGAALQQRVDSAVKKAGGNVLSSQIDLNGPQSKDGFVRLTENFEAPQPALQQVLYDLEAGTPFLFVDILNVQAPQAEGSAENARFRVEIGVYGQWLPSR